MFGNRLISESPFLKHENTIHDFPLWQWLHKCPQVTLEVYPYWEYVGTKWQQNGCASGKSFCWTFNLISMDFCGEFVSFSVYFQARYDFIWDLVQHEGFPVFSESAEVLCYVIGVDWLGGVGVRPKSTAGSCPFLQLSLSISTSLGSLYTKTSFNKLMKKEINCSHFYGKKFESVIIIQLYFRNEKTHLVFVSLWMSDLFKEFSSKHCKRTNTRAKSLQSQTSVLQLSTQPPFCC